MTKEVDIFIIPFYSFIDPQFDIVFYIEDFQKSPMESSLTCAIISHYCTCCGDTFASEIGILSNSKPFLITRPWRLVPPGTNGGITIWGTLWSGIGGFMIGLGTIFLDKVCSGFDIVPCSQILLFSTICGLLGSFLDTARKETTMATRTNNTKTF